METKYEIVRFYEDDRANRVVKRGLSREEAQAWCQDPETSSMSASKPRGCANDPEMIERWHEQQKHWFDGWREMKSGN